MKKLIQNLRKNGEISHLDSQELSKLDILYLLGSLKRIEIKSKQARDDYLNWGTKEKEHDLCKPTLVSFYHLFTTTFCHLFGTFVNDYPFFPNSRSHVFCMGLPFVWLDLSDEYRFHVKCIQNNLKLISKLKIHIDKIAKCTLNLDVLDDIIATSRGDFICIDYEKRIITQSPKFEQEDFCILLTFKSAYEHIYFKSELCSVCFHEI